MSKIIYKRDCPECGKEITYARKQGLERAIKENRLCFECAHKKRRLSPEEKQKSIQKDKENQKIWKKKFGKEYKRNYRKTHPEQVEKDKEYNKKYCQRPDIKEKNKLRLRKYRKTEKYKLYRKNVYNPWAKKYQKELRKDPLYRASSNMSRCIYESITSRGLGKRKRKRHWESIVGYTLQDLKEHLEKQFLPGMSWDNYGRKGWNIDHIIPIRFFRYNDMRDVEFRYCWSLDNLQPLWEKDNLEKGDKVILWGKEINAKYL